MNQTRLFLLVALIFIGWMLFAAWQEDYGRPQGAEQAQTGQPPAAASANAPAANAPAQSAASNPSAGGVPAPAESSTTSAHTPEPSQNQARAKPPGGASTVSDHLVRIDTDVLHLTIDSRGASIVQADLEAYPKELHSRQSVRLLNHQPAHFYVAQSGLVSAASPAPDHTATFTSQSDHYALAEGQDSLRVVFTWHDPQGLEVQKIYTLERDSYVVKLEQKVVNHSGTAWTGNAYRQLQRVARPKEDNPSFFNFSNTARYSFFGAGWYSPGDHFSKLKFSDFESDGLSEKSTGGWVAMLQQYFFAAWIPPSKETDRFSTAIVQGPDQPRYLIRASGPAFTVPAGATGSTDVKLFIGPKIPSMLKGIAPHLELAVNFGWLTVIAKPLHWILGKIEAVVGNWGFAIIILLLLIKGVFFKLSEKQYVSMAKMKKLQPKVKALKERYADDKQKQQQAMMALYKKEKANPMAGCWPMLIQIPVFIALYEMLMQSVELRHAPFIFWIQDLSAPDPFYVLPIICAVLMLLNQFLTPHQGMDPTQAKLMKFMPVGMAVFFAFFPAGLVLYYSINQLVSLLQMWYIMRRYKQHEAEQPA